MPFNLLTPEVAAPEPVTTIGAPKTSVGLTLNDMQAELDARLGGRADVISDRQALFINLAYTDLCTSIDLDELKGCIGLTMVPGQPVYKLPYVVDTIIGASIILPEADSLTGGYPLTKSDLSSYRALEADTDHPELFFRLSDLIVVWPTPAVATTVALDVRIRPAWLVQATDSPILGLEWHEGILLLARQKAHAALKEFDLAIAAGNEFTAFMRRRTDREAKEDEGRIVGSSMPKRTSDLRNRVYRRGY